MATVFKKVLLLYKKSAYAIYFLERKIILGEHRESDIRREILRFKNAHDEHYATLESLERLLKEYGFRYTKCTRGTKANYDRFDLVITVGGDGTFLEAARNIKAQAVVGINSSRFSIGKLCAGNARNLKEVIEKIARGKFRLSRWQRLRLELEGRERPVDCVNDVLICHANPAAMSRYYLALKGIKEEQRDSGLWVASAVGSSGAIQSAGGKALDPTDKKMQYLPRELYEGFSKSYRLKGGVMGSGEIIFVTSLMRNGMIFVDGTHFYLKFPFNSTLKISLSPQPINTITL
jgi:NAD+ kinase